MAKVDDDKAKRLAAALRENLKRRKAQARGSTEQAQSEGHGDGDRNDKA